MYRLCTTCVFVILCRLIQLENTFSIHYWLFWYHYPTSFKPNFVPAFHSLFLKRTVALIPDPQTDKFYDVKSARKPHANLFSKNFGEIEPFTVNLWSAAKLLPKNTKNKKEVEIFFMFTCDFLEYVTRYNKEDRIERDNLL